MVRRVLIVCLVAGLFIPAADVQAQSSLTPDTALRGYLKNGDKTYKWEVKDSFAIGGVTAYTLHLTSQRWRGLVWTHQLSVLVPKKNEHDGALLFIAGGNNTEGQPEWRGKDDRLLQLIGSVASKNNALVAVLRQTPNQPLFHDLTEDALVAFTLHNFKEDGDYSWPLLFPMVKSAVRAMDAVQAFVAQTLQQDINHFVVSGASKRGWTAWLTGAHDDRVSAIAPMVIDILNMPVNLDYQIRVWDKYSAIIQEYVKLGIPQNARTPEGDALAAMIDPYSYRRRLTMPKMIFIGTNDPYWTVDAIKHYYDSIPGLNLIHYVPNAGHDLGDKKQAKEALSAFFGMTLVKRNYPQYSWNVATNTEDVQLSVETTQDKLKKAMLWSADSDDMIFADKKWSREKVKTKKDSMIMATEEFPSSGYRAFYLDLKYQAPNGGTYTVSTRMFVVDDDELFLR